MVTYLASIVVSDNWCEYNHLLAGLIERRGLELEGFVKVITYLERKNRAILLTTLYGISKTVITIP